MPGLASFPPPLPENPYQRLLYAQTAAYGLRLVDGVHFKVWSLWRERRRVRALHLHWPQNYWRQASHPRGRSHGSSSAVRGSAGGGARPRYRLAWTIHEVRPFTTRSRWVDHLGALMLTRACHALIVNDEPTATEARRLYRLATDLPRVIEHCPYTGAYRPGRPRGRCAPSSASRTRRRGPVLRERRAVQGNRDGARSVFRDQTI